MRLESRWALEVGTHLLCTDSSTFPSRDAACLVAGSCCQQAKVATYPHCISGPSRTHSKTTQVVQQVVQQQAGSVGVSAAFRAYAGVQNEQAACQPRHKRGVGARGSVPDMWLRCAGRNVVLEQKYGVPQVRSFLAQSRLRSLMRSLLRTRQVVNGEDTMVEISSLRSHWHIPRTASRYVW